MDTKTPVPFAMVMFFPASNQIGKFNELTFKLDVLNATGFVDEHTIDIG